MRGGGGQDGCRDGWKVLTYLGVLMKVVILVLLMVRG